MSKLWVTATAFFDRRIEYVPIVSTHRVRFQVGHRQAQSVLGADGSLELWVGSCLRKRREANNQHPLYVWTNVELFWEAHRFVEARYFPDTSRLWVTINGETIVDRCLIEG